MTTTRLTMRGAAALVLIMGMGIAHAETAVRLLSLTHASDAAGDRFRLRADVPIGSYKPFQYAMGAGSRFVLELPSAQSTLEPVYQVDGTIVRTVRVHTAREGGNPISRLLFELKQEADFSIEVRGTELGVTLTPRRGMTPTTPSLGSTASAGPSTLPPASQASSVPADTGQYRIGAGDTLDIRVYDEEGLSASYVVESGGEFSFPLLGRVAAAGLSAEELQESLRRRLDRDFLVSPQVTVTVADYRSQSVDVSGAVREPGRYYLRGATRLTDVLSMAGGVAADAGEEIVVARGGANSSGRSITVLRSELYSGSRPELNVVLSPGDVIEVRARQGISVMGEVVRPGSYDWKPSLTLLQAIALAGGPTVWAKDAAYILRGQERIEVDLGALRRGKKKDIVLRPGDHVSVRRRLM